MKSEIIKEKCVECGLEKDNLKVGRNGLTCYSCLEDFASDYDNHFDPLGLRH